MLRLLIVDDEPEVLEYLYSVLRESEMLELDILKAYSGKEAVNVINATKIDILLSDIRMPGIDGFQLAKLTTNRWPKCKIIFLTGYGEFDYAYSAIKVSCEDYLLKAEGKEAILECICKTVDKVNTDLQTEELMARVHAQRERVLPVLQREMISRITGSAMDLDALSQAHFDEVDIPLIHKQGVYLFLGSIDNLPAFPYRGMSRSDSILAVMEITDGVLHRYKQKIIVEYETGCFIGLLQQDASLESDTAGIDIVLKGLLETIQDTSRETLQLTLSFAFCEKPIEWVAVYEKLNAIKRMLDFSYGISEEALFTDTFLFDGVIDKISDYEDELKGQDIMSVRDANIISDYLERGMRDEYFALLEKKAGCLRNVRSMNSICALDIYFTIANRLLSYINRWNITGMLSFRIALYKLTKVDSHGSWPEALEYLFKLSTEIFDLRNRNQGEIKITSVNFVKQYIKEHLKEDLSLSKLAEAVFYNPTYLSRLFKQITGVNLSEFIIEERIQASLPLLQNTNEKIQELAHNVGFDSSDYFTRLFKRKMNMTPQDYRDSKKGC